jgi:hypothetical protein
MLHDTLHVSAQDAYFVVGGNPDNDGGGVIGSTNSEFVASDIKAEAIKQGYKNVQVNGLEGLLVSQI